MGEMGEDDKEVQMSSYKISHRYERYSKGNIVNNIVTTLVTDGLLHLLW